MKKIIVPVVIAVMFCAACKKEVLEEKANFVPSTYVLADTLILDDVQFYKGLHNTTSEGNALELLSQCMASYNYKTNTFTKIDFYESGKATLHFQMDSMELIINANVYEENNLLIFEEVVDKGYAFSWTAFGNISDFYFRSGAALYYEIRGANGSKNCRQGQLMDKDFQIMNLSENSIQAFTYFKSPYVLLQ